MPGSIKNNTKKRRRYQMLSYLKFTFTATVFMVNGTIRSSRMLHDDISVLYC